MNKTEILIIEDNKNYSQALYELVNSTDTYCCKHVFESCEEALELIQKDYCPDVILLDIELKGMNGVEGILEFKKIIPSTDIIIITIYDDDENIFNAICNGASGFLLKNSSPEKIISSIEEVISGGAPMNGEVAKRVLKMFTRFKPAHNDYKLTDREKEILGLLAEGLTKKQISKKKFLSYHTVDTHVKNIYLKLHVNSRGLAVAKSIKENLI